MTVGDLLRALADLPAGLEVVVTVNPETMAVGIDSVDTFVWSSKTFAELSSEGEWHDTSYEERAQVVNHV